MTKIKVFIDFEAISAPFSHKLKINNDLPYAYSIGIHSGKKFKTKTTIINFNKTSVDNVFEFIRMDIIENIRDLISNKNFKVNKDSTVFVGWAPNLEKKILNKSFKGIRVIDQAKGDSISLSKATSEEFKEKEYFIELKKEVKKRVDEKFIQKRGLHIDGALAALAGYELLRSAQNKKGEWDIQLPTKTLIGEIIEYSKDDVVRMSFLHNNPGLFTKRKEEIIESNKKKSSISKTIVRLNNLVKILKTVDPEIKAKDLIEDSEKKLIELKKVKDNL